MRRATVVIGACFGDEGKAVMTDYFASQAGPDAIVVRFNGGANAGHTVVTPDGKRHVFSHFGSGSFVGCPTYFAKTAIFNPILVLEEHPDLVALGLTPKLYIDQAALMTTPFDMLMNQALERKRGDSRHGSTGVGIGETALRCLDVPFITMASLIEQPEHLESKLRYIANNYVPKRIAEIDVSLNDFWQGFDVEEVISQFLKDCLAVQDVAEIASDAVLMRADDIIFEGAQGLLLDAESQFFPHVTRSRTGLTNVVDIAHDLAIGSLDVTYVTRAYLTRHGAGPLPGETPSLRYTDDTNVHGEFQGSIRFAPLNVDLVQDAIRRDIDAVKGQALVSPSLAVTHMDQIDSRDRDWILRRVANGLGFRKIFVSEGPTRGDVIDLDIKASAA